MASPFATDKNPSQKLRRKYSVTKTATDIIITLLKFATGINRSPKCDGYYPSLLPWIITLSLSYLRRILFVTILRRRLYSSQNPQKLRRKCYCRTIVCKSMTKFATQFPSMIMSLIPHQTTDFVMD